MRQAQCLCIWPSAILNGCFLGSALHTIPEMQGPCSHFSLGITASRTGDKASASGSLWARETRWSTKKKKTKKRWAFISLLVFYFYSLGIVNQVCWCQNHDSCRKIVSCMWYKPENMIWGVFLFPIRSDEFSHMCVLFVLLVYMYIYVSVRVYMGSHGTTLPWSSPWLTWIYIYIYFFFFFGHLEVHEGS